MSLDTLPTDEWIEEGDTIQAHYSSLTLHRKCPQAWFYRYELGLRKPILGPAPELRYGSWWGALRSAEALERGRRKGSLIFPAKKFRPLDKKTGPEFDMATLTTADVFEAAESWWDNLDELNVEVFLEKMGKPLIELLRNNDERWMDEREKQLRTQNPLGVEVFWKRALPRPTSDSAWENATDNLLSFENLPQIMLIGFIDQLYLDTERNTVVAKDDKTAKALATQTAIDDMMDSQLQLYAWGVTPALLELGSQQVRAIAYDRAKSSAPTTPKLNLNGSLSASVTQYDLHTYRRWAAGPDGLGVPWGKEGEFFVTGTKKGEPKFGMYQEDPKIIEKISTPAWKAMFNQQTLVPVNRNIVRTHLRSAVDTATDIWRTKKRAELTGEAARNISKDNCKWCDYGDICRGQMTGGPEGDYDLREFGLAGPENRTQLSVTVNHS